MSKCNYFNNTDKSYCEECCSEFGCAICNDRPNCYYKQLKRKEQECEIWKNQVLTIDDETITVQITQQQFEDYNQLKAENEKLKEILKVWKYSDVQHIFKINKYEQTLTEIKEIAKNMNNECFYDDFDCEDCDMKNGCTYFNKKQILQKISEVENDNA